MKPPSSRAVTRRDFLQLGAAAAGLAPLLASGAEVNVDTKRSIAELTARYLTPQADFNTVERGEPLPYTLPLEKRRAIGLDRETWKLEVIADPESNSVLDTPLTAQRGTAFTFEALLKLAEKKATRYLKVITCNNLVAPLGMGLWEGVPLRDVLWLAKPRENIRHVFYHGYHNDDPKQIRMRAAREFLPVLTPRLASDPAFANVVCHEWSGGDGSLMLGGHIADEAAFIRLRALVAATHPPVTVVYRLQSNDDGDSFDAIEPLE